MDPESVQARAFIEEMIYEVLLRRHQQPINEMQKRRIKDLSKRLEEGMLKNARTKEEYMNLETLESRLSCFLRRASMSIQNQQFPRLVNSSPIGTMIPTTGMSHGPNSSMIVSSSIDASMIASSGCNSVNMLQAGGMLGSSLNQFQVKKSMLEDRAMEAFKAKMETELEAQKLKQKALEAKLDNMIVEQSVISARQEEMGKNQDEMSSDIKAILQLLTKNLNP